MPLTNWPQTLTNHLSIGLDQTFVVLFTVFVGWFISLLYLQSARDPVPDENTGFVSYKLEPFFKVSHVQTPHNDH